MLESHASKGKVEQIIPRLGFDSHFIQEGCAQSGGTFWCL